ncbi:MAG: hypothetical protein AAF990_09940 [Bacteroidota bacterium]
MNSLTVKRILGSVFLATFICFMAYKLIDSLSGTRDLAPIVALITVVILIIVFLIQKILRS